MSISTPKNQPPQRLERAYSLALVLLANLVIFYPRFITAEFKSGDSWSYFALSDTIFQDFYHVTLIREFQFHSFYAAWFPPLYPIVLAAVRSICDQGIYTGFFVNAILTVLIYFSSRKIARALAMPTWCGTMIYFAFLCFDYFIVEAERARSMPLAILLFSYLIAIYFTDYKSIAKKAVLLGAIAGLCVLTRFDFLLPNLALGAVFAWQQRGNVVRTIAAYYVSFLFFISPWIYYSLVHFGKPFITDNAFVTSLAMPNAMISTYFQDVTQAETLYNAPAKWLKLFFTQKLKQTIDSVASILYGFFPLTILLGMIFGLRLTSGERTENARRDDKLKSLGWLWAVFALQIATVMISGYAFQRYFSAAVFLLLISLFYLVHRWSNLRSLSSKRVGLIIGLGFLFTCAYHVTSLSYLSMIKNAPALQSVHLDKAQFKAITGCLKEQPGSRIAFVNDGVLTQKFSALTKQTTVITPDNISDKNLRAWINDYRITHVYVPAESSENRDRFLKSATATSVKLVPTACEKLFKVELSDSAKN